MSANDHVVVSDGKMPELIHNLFGKRVWWLLALASLLYLIIAMHAPKEVLASASFDDSLFMKHAWTMLHGTWLGPYGNLTLAKGPGYALFLVVGFMLGLPVTLMHALLCLAATLCLCMAIARMTALRWLPALLYLLLVFDPALLPLRVIRDSIYALQMLLLLGVLLFVLMAALRGRSRCGMATLAGALWSWFWLTREEGIWFVPTLVILFLGAAWLCRCQAVSLRPLGKAILLFIGTFLLANLAFMTANKIVYGSFVGVDFKESHFKQALEALQSVQAGKASPHVPVSRGVREDIYHISPAFAELRWNLENEKSPQYGWRQVGCGVYKNTCGDYAGGWFVWALRDAVASKGYYSSPTAAADYYGRLDDEIKKGCKTGELVCRHNVIPFMPFISAQQWREFPNTLWRAIKVLVFANGRPPLDALPSDESVDGSMTLATADFLLGRPLRSTPASGALWYQLAGWYYSKGDQWFALQCEGGNPLMVHTDRVESPDVSAAMHDTLAARQRFHIKLDAVDCPLLLTDNLGAHPIDLQSAVNGQKSFGWGKAVFYVDGIWRTDATNVTHMGYMAHIRELRERLLSVYAVLLPLIGILGFFALIAVLIGVTIRRMALQFSAVLATALWVGVVMRLLVIVMVDISAFPAINDLYMTPAYPLMIVAAMVSVYAFLDGWATTLHQQSRTVATDLETK